jgi:heparan-alpha-glucosaminide N-acetyltransferase
MIYISIMRTVLESLPTKQTESRSHAAPQRNTAIDAYRGFVMLLMMAEVSQLSLVAKSFPGNWIWSALAYNQTHVEWAGCSLHDLIQPSFSFLVGVALPYSISRRIARGEKFRNMIAHTLWRSLLLIALGIFLRSTHSAQTNFTFEDTLTQIGLGFPILFWLATKSPRWQWISLTGILVGYWLAWAVYPLPAGSPFLAHWNKNANLGSAFDLWFLNLFPRATPFVANNGGYLTLSFIPTLGTMIIGLIAGQWIRASATLKRFVIAGIFGVASGLILHFAGICPIVKRIWTPSWTLLSGGACFLLLAAFTWASEVRGYRKWAFPLTVIGMNSIAAYLMAHLFDKFIVDSFRINFGPNIFRILGDGLQPLLQGAAVLLTYWLILYWMYRRKLFLRI